MAFNPQALLSKITLKIFLPATDVLAALFMKVLDPEQSAAVVNKIMSLI